MSKVKIIGSRSGKISPSWKESNIWLNTIRELRSNKKICPTGVYRFKTFKEAEQWMYEMIAKNSLESRH